MCTNWKPDSLTRAQSYIVRKVTLARAEITDEHIFLISSGSRGLSWRLSRLTRIMCVSEMFKAMTGTLEDNTVAGQHIVLKVIDWE